MNKFWNKIVEFIFGKIREVDDDFFGKMLDAGSYYECRRLFSPINDIIEIGIDGDETGVSKIQKEFFKQIEKDYKLISENVTPIIEKELNKWNSNIVIDNFEKEFTPIYLRIPNCEESPLNWMIAFETIHDSHMISVNMIDFEPDSILIDG
jgi:hypothetical protein